MAGAVFAGSTANADTRIDNNHVRVEAGDSLYTIAQHNGTDVDTIVRDNNLTNPEMIHVGDILVVTPGQQGSAQNTQGNPATTNTTAYNNSAKVATSGSISKNSNAVSSSLSGNSAAEAIAQAESGGSYTATNGRYYGRYQLDISYLGGDLSPQHQDEVFQQYCNQRYGGISQALSFRQSHGWY